MRQNKIFDMEIQKKAGFIRKVGNECANKFAKIALRQSVSLFRVERKHFVLV